MRLRFTKMHGLGNDFIMIDAVSQKIPKLTPTKIRKLADRHFGIGCDQILVVETPKQPNADFYYRIFNADGNEVQNCGNGARCFARFVQQRGLCGKNTIVVDTLAGQLTLKVREDKRVSVDMGIPNFEPKDIPFSADTRQATYDLMLKTQTLSIAAVSIGNPHAVTLVDNVDDYPVNSIGAEVEAHARFPERVNAGFLHIVSPTEARLRVFERGVGETLACGTGACAAMAAGRMQGLLDSRVSMKLRGGDLDIEWQGEGHPVIMTGPTTNVFSGTVSL